MRLPATLLLWAGAALAAEPALIYSAAFPYQDYPRDLWADGLARLKGLGFNTVHIGGRRVDGELLELLRLARRLGLRVWVEPGGDAPDLEPFRASRGGPVLEGLEGKPASWFPPEPLGRSQLGPPDFAALRHPLLLTALDAGWPVGEDLRAPPSDPSNYLFALREALAAGARAVNCAAVLESLAGNSREPALRLDGRSQPQAAALARHGALVRHFGRLLATLEPRAALRLVTPPGTPPPRGLRLGLLSTPGSRGPAFVSALYYAEDRPLAGAVVSVRDPRTGKPMLLERLNLPPRQALLLPLNLPLASPEVCPACSSFAPDERLVSATAELLSVSFENGVLAMEFAAPGEGELVLELARQPEGPLLAAARLQTFDWDEKTRRLRVKIPPGKPPDFRSRVGLGIRLPDTSVFLEGPPRLIAGSTAVVTATFSPPELSGRARLLAPPGWRVRAEPRSASQIDYRLETPADLVPGDTVTLAVEADGNIAQSLTLPVTPFCAVRIEPEEVWQAQAGTALPLRPHLASVVLPRRRTYRLYLKNHSHEIRTFELAAAGEGLRFSPSRLEVPVGAGLEREVTLYASPAAPQPGLYRWRLTVRQGSRVVEIPAVLAVIAPDQPLAYEFDLNRDGVPEWVLENQKARVAVSPRQGGRLLEFLLKDRGWNAFAGRAALGAGQPLEARLLGPGRLELRSAQLVRTLSLAAGEAALDIDQTGGPAHWTLTTPPPDSVRLEIQAPGAGVETERRSFSLGYRVRFPDGSPRRVRLSLEPVAQLPRPPPDHQ